MVENYISYSNILENIKNNTLKQTNKTTVPYLDKDGDIEYLYNKFSEVEIDILLFLKLLFLSF